MKHKNSLGIKLALLLILAALLPVSLAWANPEEIPGRELDKAWERARQSGAYEYSTTIVQTVRPTLRLENAGLSSQKQRIYLEGNTDLSSNSMDLKLWGEGGSAWSNADGVEIKVRDGKAEGRAGGSDWQGIDDFLQLLAPDQSPLTYLVAAQNVVEAERGSRAGIAFTRYTFDLDGLAFAEYMRGRMEAELRRAGKLPVGLNLDTNRTYIDMTGTGEVWLNSDGLPLRQVVHLRFPPAEFEQVTAEISTDFTNWGSLPGSSSFLPFPGGFLSGEDWGGSAGALASAAVIGLMIWMVLSTRSPRVYAGFALVVIVSMVFTPLLQSQQILAFSQENAVRQTTAAAESQRTTQLEAFSQEPKPPLPPNLPANPGASLPLAPTTSADAFSETTSAPPRPQAVTLDSGIDSDQDGLTNVQETELGTLLYNADSDNDTLNDGIEVIEIGTDPLNADSDGDGLKDADEVKNRLDPLNPDTDYDGLLDGVECSLVVKGISTTCEDTDGSGSLIDALDLDSDGDRVPDALDMAPILAVGGGITTINDQKAILGLENRTLSFNTSGLTPGKITLVDFQLVPTNPDHLWYTLNVLDWPSDDRFGQQRRVSDSTFGSSGREANGDLRLIPMLEISIPPQSGFGGLPATVSTLPPFPIDPNAAPLSDDYMKLSAWLDSWLDWKTIEKYGISVRVSDRQGTLVLNVPLNLMADTTGDSPVAFMGRMVYQPTGADLGQPQDIRLAWLLHGLQDTCKPVADTFAPDKPESERYDLWCENAANWETKPAVIHTYYDDWYVSGLQVQESHGVDVGLIFEDPAYTGSDPGYEGNLWHLANGLSKTFLPGRAVLTTAGTTWLSVEDVVNRWAANSQATTTERWGIPTGALQTRPFHFDDPADLVTIPMTHTKQILLYATVPNPDPINVLFVRQESFRTAQIDMPGIAVSSGGVQGGILTGSDLSINMSGVQQQVLNGLQWAPYQYKGAGVWDAFPIEEYYATLDASYRSVIDQAFPQDSAIHNAGRTVLAKNLYLSLFHGATNLVALDGFINTETAFNEANLSVDYSPAKSLGSGVKDVVDAVNDILKKKEGASKAGAAAKTGSALTSSVDILAEFGVIELNKDDREAIKTFGSLIGSLANVSLDSKITKGYGAIVIGATVTAGVLVSLKLSGEGNQDDIKTALEVVDYTAKAVAVIDAVKDLKEAYDSYKTATSAVQKASKAGAIVGLVLSVGLSIGLFAAQMVSAGVQFGSLAFNKALSLLVATIIVAVIMFAIALIPVIGPLIVALVAAIDAVIDLICKATGASDDEGSFVNEYICGGIGGALAKLIAFLIYSQNPIVDIQSANRFQISQFKPLLENPDAGFQQGNALAVQMVISNSLFLNSPNSPISLPYSYQYSADNAKDATFKYAFQETKQDIEDSINLGTTPDCTTPGQMSCWGPPTVPGAVTTLMELLNSGYIVNFDAPGINLAPDLFLAEGYQIQNQECFVIPLLLALIPVCHLVSDGDTIHIDLGEQLIFDIFPSTLDRFYSLDARANEGFALDWDDRFPVLADADGDGLRSKALGGNDPNDANADSDGDGLSDLFEMRSGTDPILKDTDGEGLNDYQELFYATDPYRADTDGDGLTDFEEITGWDFVYDFDSSGNPLLMWVNADPTNVDTDGDGITDKLEKVYGFNPRNWSDLNVVRIASGVLELDTAGELVRSDGYVLPGQTLYYTATVENKLKDRFVDGLLEVDFPPAVQGPDLVPQPFSLGTYAPGSILNIQDLEGSLKVAPTSSSQVVTLTNRAASLIGAESAASAHRLLLYLDEFQYEPNVPIPDASRRGNTVSCAAACPAYASASRNGGKAAHFEAGQGILAFGPALDISQANGFTIAAQIYPISVDDVWHPVVSYNAGGPALYVHKGTDVYAVFQSEGQWYSITVYNIIKPQKWNHVLATYDAATGKLAVYVNGYKYLEEIKTNGSAPPRPNAATSVVVGNGSDGTFKGEIDEVEIFPRALTPEDLHTRYGYDLLFHLGFDYNPQNPFLDPYRDLSNYKQPISSPTRSLYDGTPVEMKPLIVDQIDQGLIGSFTKREAMDVGGHPTLNLTGLDGVSAAAWIWPVANPTWSDYTYNTVFGSDSGSDYITLITNGQTLIASVATTAGLCKASAGNSVRTDGWSHVVVVFKPGPGFTFYVNGEEVISSNLAGTACTGTPVTGQNFNIGRPETGSLGTVEFNSYQYNTTETFAPYLTSNFSGISSSLIWKEAVNLSAGTSGSWAISTSPPAVVYPKIDISVDETTGYFSWCAGLHPGLFPLPCGNFTLVSEYYSTWHGGARTTSANYGNIQSTLNWRVSNEFYQGYLDELRVYNRALDVLEARELAQKQALRLRFDEDPGSTFFVDSSGNKGVIQPCTPNVNCPIGGFPGRIGNAAHFDGNDTVFMFGEDLDVRGRPELWPSRFTHVAWIKTDGTTTAPQHIVSGVGADPYLTILDGNRVRAEFNFAEGDANRCGVETTSPVLSPNEWVHIAATFDGDLYSIYSNGTLVAASFDCSGKAPVGGGAPQIHVGYGFVGLIDDLSLFPTKALSQVEIRNLMNEAPVLHLPLDESLYMPNSTTPTYLFENNYAPSPGKCGSAVVQGGEYFACPKAGADGWIRRGVVFNPHETPQARQSIFVYRGTLYPPLESFTLGGWFRPTKRNPVLDQELVARDGSFKIFIPADSMDVILKVTQPNSAGVVSLKAQVPLIEDQWNHVAAVYDAAAQKAIIYINGEAQGSAAASGLNPDQTPFFIGRDFTGRADEFFVYDYPLLPRQIRELYQYEVRWFDAVAEHKITIDADNPYVDWPYNYDRIGKVDGQVMVVEATDLTSGIGRVEYEFINSGGTSTGWLAATPDGDAWAFPITTTYETVVDIYVRAFDRAGNASNEVGVQLLVDGDAPAVTLDETLTTPILKLDPAQDNKIALFGTVNDGYLSGSENHVLVEVLSPLGIPVGDTLEASVTFKNFNPDPYEEYWYVEYPFPPEANGSYTVRLTAWDLLGNTEVFDVGVVRVDGSAPVGDITDTGPSTQVISGLEGDIPTIRGTAGDIPYPSNASLVLHFEETSGAARFFDASSHHRTPICGPACPTAGVSGQVGAAVQFSGGQTLQVPISSTLDLANTFTAWIKPDWAPGRATGIPAVASISGPAGTRFSIHIQPGYDGVALYNGTTTTVIPVSLARGAWEHLAVAFDQGEAAVYLDGILAGVGPFVPGSVQNLPLHIGSAGDTDYYTGWIDEVTLYDRALTPDQIQAVANPVSSSISKVEIAIVHAKDRNNPASLVWTPVTLDQPDQPFTTWSYPIPAGLEGPHQISLRVTDQFTQTQIIYNTWQGEIDTLAPRITYNEKAVQINGQTFFEISCSAEDYNLVESGVTCPVPDAPTAAYQDAAWFLEIYTEQPKLKSLTWPQATLAKPGNLVICDAFNNCSGSGNSSGSGQEIFLPLVTRDAGSK